MIISKVVNQHFSCTIRGILHRLCTYHKVDVLSVCNSLKLDSQRLQVPNLHHGLICAGSNCMLAIFGGLDFDRRPGESEVLNELEVTDLVLGLCPFLVLARACRLCFDGKP